MARARPSARQIFHYTIGLQFCKAKIEKILHKELVLNLCKLLFTFCSYLSAVITVKNGYKIMTKERTAFAARPKGII
jgi:hypothetical protein